MPLDADVVVIGSGMGGGTTALALARRGVDVLVLERGQRLPREPQNWAPRDVFIGRRYKPNETWLDRRDRVFTPRVTIAPDGRIRTSRIACNVRQHRILHRRTRKLMRSAGYDFVATQHFDISMNSHQCGTVVAGTDPA